VKIEIDSLDELEKLLRLFTDAQSGESQAIINRLNKVEKDQMDFAAEMEAKLAASDQALADLDARVDATAADLKKQLQDYIDAHSGDIVVPADKAAALLASVDSLTSKAGNIEAGANKDGAPTPVVP